MKKDKNKQNFDVSNIETDKLRATFIENPEKRRICRKSYGN